jgi:hypothetical protein
MNHKRNLLIIFAFSLCLNLLGFFLDDDPRSGTALFEIYEIVMMAILGFIALAIFYSIFFLFATFKGKKPIKPTS